MTDRLRAAVMGTPAERDLDALLEQLEAANARKQELWTRLLDMESKYLDTDQALRQACMNLATIRPDTTRDGFSLGDQADLYYDALLAGWGGIEGYDRGRRPGSNPAPERQL